MSVSFQNSKMNLTMENDFEIVFTNVEETPLLMTSQALQTFSFALITLVSGVIVNFRVLAKMWQRRRNGRSATIDNLFLTYNVVSLACHPPLLVYFLFKQIIFPIGDYIGHFACGFILLFLDVYIRLLGLVVPVSIALLRYLFVCHSMTFSSTTIDKLSKALVFLTLLVPAAISILTQFPIDDYAQGPFNVCIGRFEVYFDPLNPDAVTPGRRGGRTVCGLHTHLAQSGNGSLLVRIFYSIQMALCYGSKMFYFLATTSLPEAVLYILTFRNIKANTSRVAAVGILKADAIVRRKQKNSLNIRITFWAWIIQLVANSLQFVIRQFVFGKSLFMHAFFALFQLSFNFTILPFIYLIITDEVIKDYLSQHKFKDAFIAFFSME